MIVLHIINQSIHRDVDKGPQKPAFPSAVVILLSALCLLPLWTASGQHHQAHRSPYASYEDRDIKALASEEVTQLLSGEGMGMALAAELHGYPGPRHVLDLAEELRLSEEQREATQEIFELMKEQAVELGHRIVHQEKELDRAFADGSITPSLLDTLTLEIASLRGRLRMTHLTAHLRQVEVLSESQRKIYQEVRGYAHRQ